MAIKLENKNSGKIPTKKRNVGKIITKNNGHIQTQKNCGKI